MFPAFSPTNCRNLRACLIALLSSNECAEMPEPHAIDDVTAHDSYSQVVGTLRDIPHRLRPFISEAKLAWNLLAGLRFDDSAPSFAPSRPFTRRIEMVTTPITGPTKTFICKQLDKLPPVVTDWQQCQQPRCSHYCDGECCNSGRQSASAPCPFDGKELLLVDAEAV